MSRLVPPVYEAGGRRARSVRELLATGAAARRLDAEGVAALLWRGAAVGAAMPVAGVVRVASPVPTADETPSPPRTSTHDVERALARALAAVPAGARLLAGPALAGRALLRLRSLERHPSPGPVPEPWGNPSASDLPALAGPEPSMLAGAAGGDVVSTLGGGALFGAGPVFRAFAAVPRRAARRPRPGGDPLGVAAQQRALEVAALARVEAHRLHAVVAVLPAATRAALSRVGPRPPDGIAPGTSGSALASDLVRRGPLVDVEAVALEEAARAAGVAVHCPFLDPAVVAAARGLSDAERFGEPGSGGLLAVLAGSGAAEPEAGAGERPVRETDALARRLARERLASQGVLVPEAVAEAVARNRRGDPDWTRERLLLLARLSDWIEREGLSLGGPRG